MSKISKMKQMVQNILVSSPTRLVEGEDDEGCARSGITTIDVGVIFGSRVLERQTDDRHGFLFAVEGGVLNSDSSWVFGHPLYSKERTSNGFLPPTVLT